MSFQTGDRCTNKQTFVSRADASRDGRNIRKGRVWPYQCRRCGLWHLSRLSKRDARRRGYST